MYARVRFVKDNEEKFVPCSHIRNFNPKKHDKRFSYWVFWSSFKDDSPQEMLKKVPEIPKYNEVLEPSILIDAPFNGAGYHRAAVLAYGG